MANTQPKLPADPGELVAAALAATRAEFDNKLDDLEVRLRIASGTRDLPTVPPAQHEPQLSLAERVAQLLRGENSDALAIASKVDSTGNRVKTILKQLHLDGKIHNVGSEVEPRWQHVLGDDGSAAELKTCVLRLISYRPFSHAELVTVTGARANRVSGVLAKLKEDYRNNPDYRVANLGDGSRARWFLIPVAAQARKKR